MFGVLLSFKVIFPERVVRDAERMASFIIKAHLNEELKDLPETDRGAAFH